MCPTAPKMTAFSKLFASACLMGVILMAGEVSALAQSDTSASQVKVPDTVLHADDQGRVWSFDLGEGKQAELDLDLEAGTYLFVSVESGPESLQIDLLGQDGTFIRRLAEENDTRRDFNLVVGETGQKFIARIADSGDAGPVELSVDKLVPPQGLLGIETKVELTSPRLRQLQSDKEKAGALDAFWQEMQAAGTPLIEPAGDDTALLTFLYRGAETNVRILGAPSADHDPMLHLAGTDVWYRTYEVPLETRLSYRLSADIPDVPGSFWENRVAILATAKSDPLNKMPWPADAIDPWRQKSVIELPQAPGQPFVQPDPDVAAGTVESFDFESEKLGNTRKVSLYRPAGFDPDDKSTVMLVLFDGISYQKDVDVPGILDRMQAAGVIPQTVAVLISNPNMKTRSAELPGNDAFSDVVAEEIVPLAQQKLATTVPAKRTVLSGSSYGGLASMRLALDHPDVFGNVLSMSGSFWWAPKGYEEAQGEFIARRVVDRPKQDIQVFLTAGTFEISRKGDLDILHTNRHLRDVLEAKGYQATLKEYAGAHDYLVWQGALSDGLIALFSEAK